MTRDSNKKPARAPNSGSSFTPKGKGSRSHTDDASGKKHTKYTDKYVDKTGAKPAGKTYKKPVANPYGKAKPNTPYKPVGGEDAGEAKNHPGDRIAKVLARAGVASRRDCEVIIAEGRVTVNGVNISSPAVNVLPKDRITVDGQQIGEPEPPRLWLYHKPLGLVTTEKDELGRATVFENLPQGLPRVLSVGRLDLNSEGLLLLTNDGELKRKLELPDTGWLRKYRVRVKGSPSEALLDQLRKGITIDGEDFQPMEAVFDRQQGANAWLTIGIREGRNREVRRAMEHIGVIVNRLMRISYGPFRLGTIRPGQAEEVKARVLRDQLGVDPFASEYEHPSEPRTQGRRDVSRGGKPGGPRKESFGRSDSRNDSDNRGGSHFNKRPDKPWGDKPNDRQERGFKPRGDREERDFKPREDRDDRGGYKGKRDDRTDRTDRSGRSDKPEFKSAGYKSRGGADGKGRASGFKSHGSKPSAGGYKGKK
jgi:23S rRNA pseudouridine2605 synthase